jgi:hypothetical protein
MSGSPEPQQRIVQRRCRVCEWQGERIEPVGAEFDCPWCHAPTAIGRGDSPAGAKNPHAAALGRLGGLKGGPARAARLTARERRESARKAALTRWARKGRRRAS